MPRFAILEHHWNGVHWDFLLEAGDTLRTWAINEPIVRNRLLSAHSLPDHRLFYLDYEGPVSNDRGHVARVDSGIYDPLIWTERHVRGRLEGSQFVGVFELRECSDGADSGVSTGSGAGSNSGEGTTAGERSLGSLGRETRSRWTFRLGNFD